MRVLLVEDDESIREVFKMVLEAEHDWPEILLSVDTAASGREAIEQVRKTTPDLVLLDLTLEGEDGFEVFHALRELEGCSTLPIVAVTAHNLSDIELKAKTLGFAGFVSKPIDFDGALFPLMRRLLTEKLAQRIQVA